MYYIPYDAIFPMKLADGEMDVTGITVDCLDQRELPGEAAIAEEFKTKTLAGDLYKFVETFCGEPGCDCRRVIFQVVSAKAQRLEAAIAWGWESERFYRRWMGPRATREDIADLMGPILNPGAPATERAADLLKVVRMALIPNRDFVAGIKARYIEFKTEIEERHARGEHPKQAPAYREAMTAKIIAEQADRRPVEERFFHELLAIERTVVDFAAEHPAASDHTARSVYEVLRDRHRAIALGREPKPARLDGLDAALHARLLEICGEALGGATASEERREPAAALESCFKRLLKSVDRWSGVGGRTGYLDHIKRFL